VRPLVDGRCVALDLETTGTDVHTDRIVTACAAIVEAGKVTFERQWLVAVEVDIPEAATAIHGVSTEHAREHGVPACVAVKEIAEAVRYAVHSGLPVVAFNAAFDLSMLSAECARAGLGGLAEVCNRPIGPVVDPLTIDKAVDRYRPGKRTLGDTCALFGVDLAEAHTASADAVAAARLALRMAERSQMAPEALRAIYAERRYPDRLARDWQALGRMSLGQLHDAQVRWYREQTERLGPYWNQKRNDLLHVAEAADRDEQRAIAGQEAAELAARIDSLTFDWPIMPVPAAVAR
jgi:DNA polymerase III subunit epsilon